MSDVERSSCLMTVSMRRSGFDMCGSFLRMRLCPVVQCSFVRHRYNTCCSMVANTTPNFNRQTLNDTTDGSNESHDAENKKKTLPDTTYCSQGPHIQESTERDDELAERNWLKAQSRTRVAEEPDPQGNCGAPRGTSKTKRRVTAEIWSPIGKSCKRSTARDRRVLTSKV